MDGSSVSGGLVGTIVVGRKVFARDVGDVVGQRLGLLETSGVGF